MEYYNNNKVLSFNTPFIFSLGNRSIGKTFRWTCTCINRFKTKGRKFIYMRRYDDDLRLVVPSFFDNVMQKYVDTSLEVNGNGKSGTEFLINGHTAGITVALSKAYKYKSVNMSDYDIIFFDEFLSEDNIYLPGEVSKAMSFYNTVARGYGKPIRREVRFIFVANNVSLNNPYFIDLKIRERVSMNTKYAVDEDKAWCVELTNNEEIADEILNTPYGKMIAKTKYGEYALKSKFYLDDNTFIEKPTGVSEYYCTLHHQDKSYGVYEYTELGLFYITRKANKTFPISFSLTTEDHKPNYLLLYRNRLNPIFTMLKYAFDNALLRFDTAESKMMFLDFMSYASA